MGHSMKRRQKVYEYAIVNYSVENYRRCLGEILDNILK